MGNLLQIEIAKGPAVRGDGIVEEHNIMVLPIHSMSFMMHEGTQTRYFILDPKDIPLFSTDGGSITGALLREEGKKIHLLLTREDNEDTCYEVKSIHLMQEFSYYPLAPGGLERTWNSPFREWRDDD